MAVDYVIDYPCKVKEALPLDELIPRIKDLRERIEDLECAPRVGHVLQQASNLLFDVLVVLGDLRAAEQGSGGSSEARIAVLTRQAQRAKKSLDFCEDWHAIRWRLLTDLLRSTPYWGKVAEIMANGVAAADSVPPDVQRLSLISHRMAQAEKTLATARELWRRMQVQQGEPLEQARLAMSKLMEEPDAQ